MLSILKFLINFGVHMNIIFIIKVKILVLIEWSYDEPKIVIIS